MSGYLLTKCHFKKVNLKIKSGKLRKNHLLRNRYTNLPFWKKCHFFLENSLTFTP